MYKKLGLILLSILVFSCGTQDKRAQLERLKNQRAELDEQIKKLEEEIANGGDSSFVLEKLKPVKITEIKSSMFKHYIEIQGTIESDNNIFVPPQFGGVVTKIYVKEGDRVSSGQLLAELDGTILLKSIDQLKTGLDLATTVYERQKRLWDQKIGSEIQYLQAKANKESLEKQLVTVQEQYKLTKITAPISGIVDEIKIKEGEAAAPGFGAIRIVQLSNLKIKASLSDSYVGRVTKNDEVKVLIPALDKEFNLTIDNVSQAIDANNRTFSIEIRIPGKEKGIKPNMLAVLTINDYSNDDALIVPLNVLQKTAEEESFLFVAAKNSDNWTVKKRFVKPGQYYKDSIEILEGLTTGENVVTFGFNDLADDQSVIISE
jgi:RND family efflux transporter MFP subunit